MVESNGPLGPNQRANLQEYHATTFSFLSRAPTVRYQSASEAQFDLTVLNQPNLSVKQRALLMPCKEHVYLCA